MSTWLIFSGFCPTLSTRTECRGYKEKGNINTPLELVIRNQVDRFNLAIDVIDRVPSLMRSAGHVKEWLKDQILIRSFLVAPDSSSH